MKYFWLILFLALSCGKRDLENQVENPFLGNWELSEISCYVNDYLLLEKYTLPAYVKVNLNYVNGTFVYQVNGPGCSMKYSGEYFYSITSFNDGKQSFYASKGPSSVCEVNLQEELEGVINPVSLYWSGLESKDIFWEFSLEEKELLLSGPFVFKGGNASGDCSGQCLCFGHYKISSDT